MSIFTNYKAKDISASMRKYFGLDAADTDEACQEKCSNGTCCKEKKNVAEDELVKTPVPQDKMLPVMVGLCAVEILAKDLHYRAMGKSFYAIHELADIAYKVGKSADDLNEVYYMGEKSIDPPPRAMIAGKAAHKVGKPTGEDDLINRLIGACEGLASAVEFVKQGGVTGGTSAVLDEISKNALQARALLKRTMMSINKAEEGRKAIDNVIGRGFTLQNDEPHVEEEEPEAAAQDAGGLGNFLLKSIAAEA